MSAVIAERGQVCAETLKILTFFFIQVGCGGACL
jgi:hypothetical protein